MKWKIIRWNGSNHIQLIALNKLIHIFLATTTTTTINTLAAVKKLCDIRLTWA